MRRAEQYGQGSGGWSVSNSWRAGWRPGCRSPRPATTSSSSPVWRTSSCWGLPLWQWAVEGRAQEEAGWGGVPLRYLVVPRGREFREETCRVQELRWSAARWTWSTGNDFSFLYSHWWLLAVGDQWGWGEANAIIVLIEFCVLWDGTFHPKDYVRFRILISDSS